MAIFRPSSALSSVDLPALGRPRMLTNPARCLVFICTADLLVRAWPPGHPSRPGGRLRTGRSAVPNHTMASLSGYLRYSHLIYAQVVRGQHRDGDALALDVFAHRGHVS